MQVRCPHCHTPIELSCDSELSDIPCPSCGSSFSLLGGDETTPYKGGTKTIGHFELVEQIGVGSFGFVWRARDTELDRTVAVKMPRKGQLDPEETEQFLREARAAAQLRHANIVSVHEVGRDDDSVFIVSDFVEGVTLADRLTAQPFSIREAAELWPKIADALHHAHEQGVIHRDLKPGNIILDADGKPHIMDFGLARREVGEVTMTIEGRVLGTPAYMSPEQAKGDAHTAGRRSDVYSLGVILFELLTGERPFRGNARMLVHQVINDEAPSPRRLNGSVPRDLETICLKCLEKEPSGRYLTAAALAEDLRRYVDRKPIRARPIGRAERSWRWCKRNPVVSGLSVGLLLVLILGLLGTGLALIREQYAREQQELQLYFSQVNLAYVALNSGDRNGFAELMRRLISRAVPNIRDGIEWRYLQSRYEEMRRGTEIPTSGAVLSLSFSPAGQLAIGCDDGSICIHGETSEDTPVIPPHVSGGFVSFSSNGKYLVTSDINLEGPSPGRSRIWEFPSLTEVVWDWPNDELSRPVIAPNETLVAANRADGFIEVQNLLNGELVNKFEGRGCAFSPDGSRLAIVVGGDHGDRIELRDVKSGQLLDVTAPLELGVSPNVIAFAPDGTAVVAGGHHYARLWSVSNDQLQDLGWRIDTETYAIAFSADGYFALGCSDQTVKIWKLTDGRPQLAANLLNTSTVTAVAFSRDNQRLVAGARDNTVRFWDARMWKEDHVRGSGAHIHPPLAVSSDGTVALSETRDRAELFKLWNPSDGDERIVLRDAGTRITSAAFSADGQFVACGDFAGRIRVWNAASRTLLRDIGDHEPHPVLSLAFSRKDQLASGSSSKVLVWDNWRTGKPEELTGPTIVSSVIFSPHGYLAVGGGQTWNRNGEIQVWNLETGEPVFVHPDTNCPETVRDVAFSSDGSKMAVIYEFSAGIVRVYDTTTWTHFDMQCHSGKSTQLAFAGDRLITGSDNDTLRFWDLRHRQPVGTLRVGRKVRNLAVFPDERTFVTATRVGWVRLWRALPR